VVKRSRSLIETKSSESELLKIEMMAEFVARSAQKCAKGRDFFPHSRPDPYPDQHGLGMVVPENLARPLLSTTPAQAVEVDGAACDKWLDFRASDAKCNRRSKELPELKQK